MDQNKGNTGNQPGRDDKTTEMNDQNTSKGRGDLGGKPGDENKDKDQAQGQNQAQRQGAGQAQNQGGQGQGQNKGNQGGSNR